MVYILLTVSISVSLLVVFKLFEKWKVNTFNAIILNYAFAALTGITLLQTESGKLQLFKTDAITLIIPLGLLFIAVFYAISQTAQKISISVASVANKMSVILPVLFSVIILKEQVTIIKIIGILLALLSVIFTMYRKTEQNQKFKWHLPLFVFIGSGLIDIGMNYANSKVIINNNDTLLFSASIFLSAFCFGIIYKVAMKFKNQKNSNLNTPFISGKDLLGGMILGIPNYFSIYFMLKALSSGVLNSALLFPVLNVSNVLLTALIGLIFYKENLSKLNYSGLMLAVISLILIALS